MEIEKIFINIIPQKILKFLAENPEKIFFDSEIAQKIGISVGACNQTLKILLKNNLVEIEKKGRMNFYQINSENSLIKQFKVFLTILSINKLIEKIKKHSISIALFGSASRGENLGDSDIDLFVLSRQKEMLESIIKKFGNKKIKALIKTPTEVGRMEKTDLTFYNEITKGIVLQEARNES